MSKNSIRYDIRTLVSPDGIIKQDLMSETDRGMALISRQVINTKEDKIREALLELGWTPPGQANDMAGVFASMVAREREAKERALARGALLMGAIQRLIEQGARCCFIDDEGYSLIRNAAYAHLLELATSDGTLPEEAAKMLEALRFYADRKTYQDNLDEADGWFKDILADGGGKAREALGIYD